MLQIKKSRGWINIDDVFGINENYYLKINNSFVTISPSGLGNYLAHIIGLNNAEEMDNAWTTREISGVQV